MFDFLKRKFKKVSSDFEERVDKSTVKERIVKRLTEKVLSVSEFNELFNEIELILLQANVAISVINSLRSKLMNDLINKSFKRGKFSELINSALSKALDELLIEGNPDDILKFIKSSSRPVSFMFIGTNGSGKTTSVAKFAKWLLKNKVSVVLAACDTFRAASIEQLEVHGEALGVKVIKHSYGSDAAAVAFDAVKHASAKAVNAVLIDTAGRSHSNINLMRELEKVKRVVNPDFTIFVGDSLTGNDVVLQCRDFMQSSKFDYVILTKTDVDEKGGAVISVSHESGAPILFLGGGQGYDDLKRFSKKELISQLLS